MDDDDLPEYEELEALVRISAARRARAIVKREGAALVMSARDLDKDAVAADSQLLAIAIAQAIVDAFSGNIEGNDVDEPDTP